MRDLAVRAPAVEALKKALGCKDLFEWVELEATRLARLGGTNGRVNLAGELLRNRGITAVVKEDSHRLAHDAVIEFGSAGYVIRYLATTPARIRFSVAHEIAHTYFTDVDGCALLRLERRTDPTVESICDYFARALLLPRDRLVARLKTLAGRKRIPSLHLVPQLAGEFEVSEQSVARRLVFDLFEGFFAVACITTRGEWPGWQTTWCAPLGAFDLPKSSGWRVPLNSSGRKVPYDMVPRCDRGRTAVTSVDGRWADLCRPKTIAQCRVPFARLPAMAGVEAVVGSVAVDRGLFDEPLERCFVALRERSGIGGWKEGNACVGAREGDEARVGDGSDR